MNNQPYILAPAAAMDLAEIWDFIAADSVDAADRVLEQLLGAMRMLADRPGLGHLRGDVASESVRFWRVFTYLIVYLPDTEPLQVVRVLSGYRDLASALSDLGG